MTISRMAALALIIFFLSSTLYAQSTTWRSTRIPMEEAGKKGLETLLVWPTTPGKHPLLILSHGSPRNGKQRANMSAISYYAVAKEFAKRGFVVAVVMRRGYGTSGGGWAESYGSCNATTYKQAAIAAAADLRAAIKYLVAFPEVDPKKIIAVGVSAGGFATVALTALSPPKGLVAAISFAGGRGSISEDNICQEDELISTFGFLGKTSRVPMLWIYAENDRFFSPELADEFLNAFNKNGGKAILIKASSFATDGHSLFSKAGIPVWEPLVDSYLQKKHLGTVPVESVETPALVSPAKFTDSLIKREFAKYLSAATHKAFAVDPKGAFGWRSGRISVEDAKQSALALCARYSKLHCKLYAIDNGYVKEE